ncbi:MAG: ATP-binding protein, partial [Burkholderiaceae bacterium]
MTASLQFRLSVWLALVIVGTAVAAGAVSFVLAYQEAIELQDDQLRQTAAVVDARSVGPSQATPVDTDIEARMRVLLVAPATAATTPAEAFPAAVVDGIQTVRWNGASWRAFVKPLATGERIAVAQRTALRDEIARDSALHTLAPILFLMPILLLLVHAIVRRTFAPLKRLAAEVDRRGDHAAEPLTTRAVPAEVRPFIDAIERLLLRLARSAALQRRFVADAAHELRSPLTALSLQAQQLEAVDMSSAARQRLGALRGGIQRSCELLEQMLNLARAQQPAQAAGITVSLRQILRQVLEDLMPLADAKDIDLGVEGENDARVLAHEADLVALVRNLVENAIRYSPPGGRIDLRILAGEASAILQIDDSGPGIAEQERDRVFDPFYRLAGSGTTGSGLG